MKRYSVTYFLGQSIKGLWRNGVMSVASIMVLMSCLVVMGSFSLLVYNINVNLEKMSTLNEIVVYADTKLSEITDEERVVASDTPYTGDIVSMISETAGQVEALDDFTDLEQAYITAGNLRASMSMLKTAVEASGDASLNADYAVLEASFETVYHRVATIKNLQARIKSLNNVSSAIFTSKAAGLEEMKEHFSDYPELFDKLRKNPLTEKFTITYEDNSSVATLQFNLENLDPVLYKVNCRSDVAAAIEQIKNGVILVFSWFLVILFVVSIFVIINTIKLAVFSRRQEISIMRYVGATNTFIVLPFIFEGILIGLIAGGLAYFVQMYTFGYAYELLLSNFQMVTIVPFEQVKNVIACGFLSLGVVTGILGSSVSLHRYLKA